MSIMGGKDYPKIKLYIEMPKKWVDLEEPTGFPHDIFRTKLETLIKEGVVEKMLEQMELPKIKITPQEIKNRMLLLLAERALENNEG